MAIEWTYEGIDQGTMWRFARKYEFGSGYAQIHIAGPGAVVLDVLDGDEFLVDDSGHQVWSISRGTFLRYV
ncbi:hypothetical protein BH09ACT10_BH09ACT10_15990 [soil metagenome]